MHTSNAGKKNRVAFLEERLPSGVVLCGLFKRLSHLSVEALEAEIGASGLAKRRKPAEQVRGVSRNPGMLHPGVGNISQRPPTNRAYDDTAYRNRWFYYIPGSCLTWVFVVEVLFDGQNQQ